MRAHTLFISAQTQSVLGTTSTITTTASDSLISISDVVVNFGNSSESSSYGDFNVFVDSVSTSPGTITSVLGKSSITPEGTPDTIDTVLMAAR